MQEKIKVVIADDNLEFAEIVREFLNHKPDIEVLEIANNDVNEFCKTYMQSLI